MGVSGKHNRNECGKCESKLDPEVRPCGEVKNPRAICIISSLAIGGIHSPSMEVSWSSATCPN